MILTRKLKDPLRPNIPEVVIPTLLLSNIRVLAIDQAPKEKDGQTSLVGRTATLELKPEQAGVLAAARQAGTLSLALRSIADANAVELDPNELTERRGVSINVVRYGVPSQASAQK